VNDRNTTSRASLIVAAIFAVILLFSGPDAAANPFDSFGAGVRANAMGGAYAALSEDIAGAYYNPAALTQVHGLQFEFGYHYAEPHLKFNNKPVDVDKNAGWQFGGLASQLIFGKRFSAGANIFIPDDHVMRFLMLPRSEARYVMYSNDNHVLVANVAMGLEIIKDRFSVGFGLSLMGDNAGGVDMQVTESESSTASLDSYIKPIYSPIFGLWGRPLRFLRLGLCYREKTEVKLDLPNIIHIPELETFEENSVSILAESEVYLLAESYSHFSPRMIQLGTAWDIGPRFLVSADITWQQWSAYHDQSIYMVIELEGGLGELFDIYPQPPLEEPDFKDIFVPAFGMEFVPIGRELWTIALRSGYWYRPSPAPDQKGISNFADSNTHAISAGIGISAKDPYGLIPKPFSVDAYGRIRILEEREIVKDSLANPSGDYTIGGNIFGVGAAVTMRF
jgi:long-subunit fatty acid transport protein